MAEEKDVDKAPYPVKKPAKTEDIYEGIERHDESERGEERKGGPEAPMETRRGPIVLSPSTYVEEDIAFEEEKRRPPGEQRKKPGP